MWRLTVGLTCCVLLAGCGAGTQNMSPARNSGTEVSGGVSGAGALTTYCTACHLLDRALVASKTRDQWTVTVQRMSDLRVQMYANANDAIPGTAQHTIVEYLLRKNLAEAKP